MRTIFTKRRSVVFWPNDKTVIIVLLSFVYNFKMVRVRLPRRNFCVRLRHNALSGLDIFKINLFRAKFRRYALADGVIQLNHPVKPILIALSILNLLRARRIVNKVWIRKKKFIYRSVGRRSFISRLWI